MICIILVAGHGVVLEKEIQEDDTRKYSHLIGIPKALLPARPDNGETILDYWWNALKSRQQFSEVYLVTNADKYKHYERWASAHEFPLSNIINDGSTTYENSLGGIADVDLALRCKNIKDDIMVVAGDMLFSLNFDMGQVIDYFKLKQANLIVYYELSETENTETRGIVEVDQNSGKITKFFEKPKAGETASRLASPVFYCLKRSVLPRVSSYTQQHKGKKERALGHFMSEVVKQGEPVLGMKLPTRFQLIGQIGLKEYTKWIAWFQQKQSQATRAASPLTCRTYARIGLIGNPSDGFNGKTISLSIANFWADVTISESQKLKLSLHPLNDPTEFGSLSDLYGISRKEGYMGGLRLMQATCKKFYQYCAEQGIALARKNFTLKYDTNIPRQVGLAGSSAIIASTLNCLMKFFGLTESDMPKQLQPNFILDVEMSELFIQAGLQDRVIQVYEGLVYMDFNETQMKKGHGLYEKLPVSCLPPLWLAYLSDPSDSGKIHSTVKQRWVQGDKEVMDAMKHFGKITDQARTALSEGNHKQLFSLLDENFDTRLSIYGKDALGSANLEMIEIARKHGSCAKFSGSGGAVFGMCLDEEEKSLMAMEFQEKGYVFCDILPFEHKT